MKKLISCLLLFTILFGMLSSFSFAVEVDTPYSGGSGTEEDPYLISTEYDILELHNAMKTDPSLWYTKYYYKLTNNIETNYDLDIQSCTDEYSASSFQLAKEDEEYYLKKLVPIYVGISGEAWRYNDRDHAFEVKVDRNNYYNSFFDRYGGEGYPSYVTDINYYWNAAFTGVFDGNGYTVTMNNRGYFFGFVENEAIIKNLTVEGENASFAYCLDDTSLLLNCTTNNSPEMNDIAYQYGKTVDGITDDGFAYTVTENSEIYISALMEFSDTVVIPETIDGLAVVGIDDHAFVYTARKIDIENLYIHSGIMEIATDAFGYNSGGPNIGTIYYGGTEKMFRASFFSEYGYSQPADRYNVVYADSVPIEGFALKNGDNMITLRVGESFRPEYEYYPEKAQGQLYYSVENRSIVSVSYGLITAKNAGETTVTVTAESDVTYTFTVKVVGAVGISVMNPPSKTYYGLREALNVDGLKIIKQYNDGTFVEVTDYKLSSFNPLQRGIQVITVTGEGFTTTFNVFVSGALKGDIDLDGIISSMDSNRIRRTIVGEIKVEEYTDEYFASDLNGDGEINALDSALLKATLVGK